MINMRDTNDKPNTNANTNTRGHTHGIGHNAPVRATNKILALMKEVDRMPERNKKKSLFNYKKTLRS